MLFKDTYKLLLLLLTELICTYCTLTLSPPHLAVLSFLSQRLVLTLM